jgi:hypothetical protein
VPASPFSFEKEDIDPQTPQAPPYYLIAVHLMSNRHGRHLRHRRAASQLVAALPGPMSAG